MITQICCGPATRCPPPPSPLLSGLLAFGLGNSRRARRRSPRPPSGSASCRSAGPTTPSTHARDRAVGPAATSRLCSGRIWSVRSKSPPWIATGRDACSPGWRGAGRAEPGWRSPWSRPSCTTGRSRRRPASIVPYLVCFARAVGLPRPGRLRLWLIAAAALLGGGAHLLNAIPDLEADRVTGIRGLPQRLGARPSLPRLAAARWRPPLLSCRRPAAGLGQRAGAARSPPRSRSWAGSRHHAPPSARVMVMAGIDVGLLLLSGAP